MRKPFIAGNWKMNKTNGEARETILELKKLVTGRAEAVEILIAPPFTALQLAAGLINGSGIKLGAQNLYYEDSGAFTGEVSAPMLASCGCDYVIVGHSERRQYFGCTDEIVNRKLKAAVRGGVKPIVCIGETLQEREGKRTFDVLGSQLSVGLRGLSGEEQGSLTVAYEPVWAIGTGMTATPDQAQEAHSFIRKKIEELYGEKVSGSVRILYGGSVKPDNITDIMRQKDVDGALVGGASLKPSTFADIVNYRD